MSSPMHRPILSPKHSNSRSVSPIKNDKSFMAQQIESPYNNQRIRLSYNNTNNTSPTKKPQVKKLVSPTKTRPSKELSFTIFEDDVYYRDTLTDDTKPDDEPLGKENDSIETVRESRNKLNHDDQENILQPKLKQSTLKQASIARRKPLSNLNINEFSGYVTYNQFPIQLNELYQPPNFQNELKSIHKFNSKLPCFVTPPRSNLQNGLLTSKYLVKSAIEEEPFNEEDEVEHRLMQKHSSIKKRRSLSVGKNDSKFKLIKKNNFQILTN